MGLSAEELAELRSVFQTECDEHVEALNGLLLELEHQPDDEAALTETFRRMHSIKGAARSVGLGSIEAVAHAMEALLAHVRDRTLRLEPARVQALLEGTDLIAELMRSTRSETKNDAQVEDFIEKVVTLDALAGDEMASVASPTGVPRKIADIRAAGGETVRVGGEKIDRLIALRGELLRELLAEESDLATLHSLLDEAERGVRELGRYVGGASEHAERYLQSAGRQHEQLQNVVGRLDEHNVMRLRLLEELLHGLAALRMLPVQTILAGMPRVVRDVAQSLGKRAELAVTGGEVEIDKAILDALAEPLVHLVRNAVAHGIEAPDVRVRAGKRKTGSVRISVTTGTASATITVEDDGGGIDLEVVRAKAISDGFVTAETAATMPDAALLPLLFKPGFTTTAATDTISGRGVGLDVVAACAARLRGSCHVDSALGRGARFVLSLPVSLLTSAVLVVRSGDLRICLRQTDVREAVMLSGKDFVTVDGRAVATLRSEIMPVVTLSAYAGGSPQVTVEPDGAVPVIILEHSDLHAAFVVEQLSGVADVIVKALPAPLGKLPGVAGYAILTDGVPLCVLDGEYVVSMAHRRELAAALAAAPSTVKRSLLIVEDSMTTRILLRNIMHGAGYDVETAVDGVDAWNKIQQRQFECILADIQMPNMNGWELVARIKADPRFANTPVVLVTALAKDEERRRGLELGADAYIAKGLFNEAELLRTVERLVA